LETDGESISLHLSQNLRVLRLRKEYKNNKGTSMAFSLKEVWTTALNKLSQQIRLHFVRPESHQRVLANIQGLMSGASRKKV
jgi:hypothetical protein